MYEYKPELILEVKRATILWDFVIQTSRKIKRNRPNVVVKDYKRKTHLIDMTVPTNHNISVEEFDKMGKYQEVEIEIEKM